MRQRLVARDALLNMRQQVRNQRHALLQWPVVVEGVRQHLDALIADLDRRIAALEAEITTVLTESIRAESLACLTSAPGIGLVTASWLLVSTLNFALCDGPEALTAYTGLAPVPRESGRKLRGQPRIGHDGNSRLRTALYLATRSAARDNPAIRSCYQRLRAAGKPQQVAALRPRISTTTRGLARSRRVTALRAAFVSRQDRLRLGAWFAGTPRRKPQRSPFARLLAEPLAA